jgi:hypothetical protein
LARGARFAAIVGDLALLGPAQAAALPGRFSER